MKISLGKIIHVRQRISIADKDEYSSWYAAIVTHVLTSTFHYVGFRDSGDNFPGIKRINEEGKDWRWPPLEDGS